MNVGRRGINAIGRDADLARNRQLADLLMQTGPERDAPVTMLADAVASRASRAQKAELAGQVA